MSQPTKTEAKHSPRLTGLRLRESIPFLGTESTTVALREGLRITPVVMLADASLKPITDGQSPMGFLLERETVDRNTRKALTERILVLPNNVLCGIYETD